LSNKAFKMGDRVKVTNNTAGANIAVGTVGKITHVHNAGQCHPTAMYQFCGDKGEGRGLNIYQQDMALCPTTREDIKKEADSLRAQIAALDAQIAYLDETKSESYDDLEWRCYQALKAIKNSNDTVETSKVVAKLVRNEV
jgi:hypothetical protein